MFLTRPGPAFYYVDPLEFEHIYTNQNNNYSIIYMYFLPFQRSHRNAAEDPVSVAKSWIRRKRDQSGLEKRFVSQDIGRLLYSMLV